MIPPICRWPVPVECATPPRPARSAHPSPEILPAPTTCIVSRRPGLRIHRRPPCCRIRPPNPDPAGRPAFGNAARSASTSPNPRERLPGVRARGLGDVLAGYPTISLTRSDRARTGRGIGSGFATTPTPAQAQGRSGASVTWATGPDLGAGRGPGRGRCARCGPGCAPPARAPLPASEATSGRNARQGAGAHHRSPRRRRRRAGRRPRPPGSLASRPAGRASRPDAKEAR